jgi:hypothetical protein
MRLSGRSGFILLFVDAIINIALGVLLLLFTEDLVDFFGVPPAAQTFYPNMLGAVLFGIGLALLIECFRKPQGLIGLGLGGAVAINLCGGLVLAAWLIFGGLDLPLRGMVFLWVLVAVLVGISTFELVAHLKSSTS